MFILSFHEWYEKDRSPIRGNSTSWVVPFVVLSSDSSFIVACGLSNAVKIMHVR